MKIFVRWLLASLIGAAIPLSIQASEHEHEEHEEGRVHLTSVQQAVAGVKVESLRLRDIGNEIRAPGEVQLNLYATSRVTPRISAQVVKRQARLGDIVKQGQVLLTLSSVEMAQAQGDLLVAERNWQRVRKLSREVVSEQRYTEARIKREQARARVNAYGMTAKEVKKLVSSGKAELANGRFRLLAPQDGTVIHDDFITGELIEPGRVLFEISDESILWIEARLSPEEAAEVTVGANVSVVTNGDQVNGKVSQVHHALDESTRTLGVRIEIPNRDDQLHPGLFVEARIEGKTLVQVLAVPNDAVQRSSDGDWQVFVKHDSNEFESKEIEVIHTTSRFTVIEGLKPGAQVVTTGAFFLQSELAKAGFDIHNH